MTVNATGRCAQVIALLMFAAGAVGCAEAGRPDAVTPAEQRTALMQRDLLIGSYQWQLVAQGKEIALRDAKLRELTTAQQFVAKLSELMVLNADVAARLERAEVALESLAKQSERTGEPALTARAQIEDVRLLGAEKEARTAAYHKLLTSVQSLVDSGQVKAVLRDGRLVFTLPRPIDESDPWARSEPVAP
jgi:hypothetical protein